MPLKEMTGSSFKMSLNFIKDKKYWGPNSYFLDQTEENATKLKVPIRAKLRCIYFFLNGAVYLTALLNKIPRNIFGKQINAIISGLFSQDLKNPD